MSTLGDLIKKTRVRLGLSQRELGKKLEVPQGTISAWERGRQRPSDKALLDKLSEYLKIERQQLTEAYESQPLEEVGLEPDEVVASTEQQHYIEEIGYENAEVWLLSPSTLPVIESSTFRNIWANNLFRGTTYCILWCLDFVEPETFRKIAPALYDIEQKLKGLQQENKKNNNQRINSDRSAEQKFLSAPIPGKINHYATIISKDSSVEKKITFYTDIQQESLKNNLNNIVFHSPKQVDLLELLQYSNPYGSLVLYRDRQASLFKTPLALISLASVRVRASEGDYAKSKRVFYFLSKKQAEQLDRFIKVYIQEYSNPT